MLGDGVIIYCPLTPLCVIIYELATNFPFLLLLISLHVNTMMCWQIKLITEVEGRIFSLHTVLTSLASLRQSAVFSP